MTGIKIPVEAELDQGDLQRTLAGFAAQLNKIGQAVAQANKVKFNPIDKATVTDIQKVTQAFDNLRKISGDLNRRLKTTGQGGAGFTDVDWSRLYPDANVRARQMQKSFEYVVGNRFTSAPLAPTAPQRPGRAPPPPTAPGGGGGGGGGGFPGRGVVGAGLNAMGPAGSVANSALSAGLAGGVGAGLAGLAGGMAALLVGKTVGAVMDKVGQAQQQQIGYDTLKRTLGDVNVSFNVLRESLKESARAIDLTFEESQRLGLQFTKLSGISAEHYKSLAAEVALGGGFSRSFGLDPSQGVGFMGQMRMHGVTSNTQQSRELALLIGEAIAKSGTFSKADDVLEAIANFTAMQTRSGMNVANVGGFAGMLTGMMGSRIPGMDPQGAAALLGRVNSSIAGGGSAGEAGQNFLYSALGTRLGLNPIQAAILREQGAFGTGAGTFGAGSVYSQFAKKNGLEVPGQAAGSSATNLQLIMEKMKQVYAGKPELMVNAMSNLFGVNNSQAMALSLINPTTLGGLSSRLKRNGVNINDVNASGISKIAQIEADGSLSDAEKDKRIKEAATQNQEETEGSRTRATINGVERAVTNAAEKMVPLMNDMRAGIMYLAGEGGKRSPRDILESIARADSKDKMSQIDFQYQGIEKNANKNLTRAMEARQRFEAKNSPASIDAMTPEQKAAYLEAYGKLIKEEKEAQQALVQAQQDHAKAIEDEKKALEDQVDSIRRPPSGGLVTTANFEAGGAGGGRGLGAPASGGASDYDELFAKYGKMWGVDPKLLKAIAMKESGMNPNAVGALNPNGTRDYGLMQHNSAYITDRGITDWRDPEQQISAAAKLLRQNIDGSGGDVRTGVRKYNGSGPRAESYADDIMRRVPGMSVAESSTPMPPGMMGPPTQQQTIQIGGTFNLVGPNGQPAATPVSVSGRVPLPAPQGGR